MVCFYKWCVFTNGVLLQIVWMSVWLCCADTLGPAYPMLVSPGQKLRADASGNHSKYSVSHVTHVSFSIRVRIIRIFSGYSHLHSYVLSGIVESFRKSSIFQLSMKGSFENWFSLESTIFWWTFSRHIHKKLGHVWMNCFICNMTDKLTIKNRDSTRQIFTQIFWVKSESTAVCLSKNLRFIAQICDTLWFTP